MKTSVGKGLLLFMVVLPSLILLAGDSRKSFLPGELWPDNNGVHINAHGGGILLHGGVYYWFGEHKIEGEAGNRAQVGVHVYSSRDLYGWKDEGVALAVSEDPASDITRGSIIERPKVIYCRKTGQFVMWFHLELKGQGYRAARSGVAVSDRPTGPYGFVSSFRPNSGVWPENLPLESRKLLTPEEREAIRKLNLQGGPVPGYPEELVCRRDFEGGQMARDMTLYVDDDGKAWHIYASEENGTLQISQLSDDYLRPAGLLFRAFPGGFNEAPAVFKHQGKYYL
ncbi:MAG: beta-glucanase, partial [Acidobacteria bacterium]